MRRYSLWGTTRLQEEGELQFEVVIKQYLAKAGLEELLLLS
jgi:hypothetical protein